jgi:hypothetical protein
VINAVSAGQKRVTMLVGRRPAVYKSFGRRRFVVFGKAVLEVKEDEFSF